MKKFIKKYWAPFVGSVIFGALVLTPLITWAASVSGTTSSGGAATNMVTGALRINSITLANATAGQTPFTIYDAPGTATTFTNDVYVTHEATVAEVVRSYTDILGNTVNITNNQVVITQTTNSASTNNYRIIAAGQISANATQVITPTTPLYVSEGFMIVGPTNTTVTVDYTALTP